MALANDAPRPPRVGLAAALTGWLQADRPEGVTADVRMTSELVASGGLADGSGLLAGASGRLWLSADGRARLDVRTTRGDATVTFDGRRLTLYDAATNTVYRLDAPASLGAAVGDGEGEAMDAGPDAPAIAGALATLASQAHVTGPEPGSVAGQATYTVRVSPRRDAGLLGAAELAWDAARGVPLRFALYAADAEDPVIEVRATKVSYGPVDEHELALQPPADARVVDLSGRLEAFQHEASEQLEAPPVQGAEAVDAAVPFALRAPEALVGLPRQDVRLVAWDGEPAAIAHYGRGLGQLVVLQQPTAAGQAEPDEGGDVLPRVAIEGARGWELATALGTIVRVQRDGVLYTIAGSVPAVAAEAAVRELLG